MIGSGQTSSATRDCAAALDCRQATQSSSVTVSDERSAGKRASGWTAGRTWAATSGRVVVGTDTDHAAVTLVTDSHGGGAEAIPGTDSCSVVIDTDLAMTQTSCLALCLHDTVRSTARG